MMRAIGIDLGTTNTAIATLDEKGKATIVPNAEGEQLTPSVVAFPMHGRPLVGRAAKRQAEADPERTVFSIKRRMGLEHVVAIGPRGYTPQEVSSLILQKVKADAEQFLRERIRQVVITVPAYFNDLQREATREAARLADLEAVRLLNEPTATALAYGLAREQVHTVLVWDLGGGTFDISILELGDGVFEVRAVSGDTGLGGDDWDARIASHLAHEYRRLTDTEYPADVGAQQQLREVAERAKVRLSSVPAVRFRFPLGDWSGARHLEVDLTRDQVEAVTADLRDRMVGPTCQALQDAGLTPNRVDRLLLAGGASQMPTVRALARQMFGREAYRFVNPGKVVAMGAAIYAGMLAGQVQKAVLLDVLPLTVGVETQGGLMAKVIPRNTPLPATEGRLFTTAAEGQTSMEVHILQGERELAQDNVSLGRVELAGIPPAPRGAPRVEIAFHADVDGIIQVTARELQTEASVEARVITSKALAPDEVERLVREAQKNTEADREGRERIQAGIEADLLLTTAEALLAEVDGLAASVDGQRLADALVEVKSAMAGGTSKVVRQRSEELRQLLRRLAESHQDNPRQQVLNQGDAPNLSLI